MDYLQKTNEWGDVLDYIYSTIKNQPVCRNGARKSRIAIIVNSENRANFVFKRIFNNGASRRFVNYIDTTFNGELCQSELFILNTSKPLDMVNFINMEFTSVVVMDAQKIGTGILNNCLCRCSRYPSLFLAPDKVDRTTWFSMLTDYGVIVHISKKNTEYELDVDRRIKFHKGD